MCPGDGGGPTGGDKPPGVVKVISKDSVHDPDYHQQIEAAKQDGYREIATILYKEVESS